MKKNSKHKLASSYAQAMYEAAAAAGAGEQVFADVVCLGEALKQDGQIEKMLSSPLWRTDAKKAAVAEIGIRLGLNEVTVNTLEVAADNNRLGLLGEMLSAFTKIYYTENNMAEVHVKSAMALLPEQDRRLKKSLEKWLNKKVVVKYTIKPGILGGLLIECGSLMVDDSVKGKLDKLELLMKGTK